MNEQEQFRLQREANDQACKEATLRQWTKKAQVHQNSPQFKLRLTEELHGKLAATATLSNRSMSAEVVHCLERTLGVPSEHGRDLTAVPTADLLAELGRRCER